MGDVENKRKHLELIQGAISRLPSNSFLLSGTSVTVILVGQRTWVRHEIEKNMGSCLRKLPRLLIVDSYSWGE